MKNRMIVLMLGSVCCAANAQTSSVTVFGVVDLSLSQGAGSTASRTDSRRWRIHPDVRAARTECTPHQRRQRDPDTSSTGPAECPASGATTSTAITPHRRVVVRLRRPARRRTTGPETSRRFHHDVRCAGNSGANA